MNQKRLLIKIVIAIIVIIIGIVGYFIYSSYQPTTSEVTINDVREIATSFCGKPYKLDDLPIKSVQLCGDKLLLNYSGGGTICNDCPYIILDTNGNFLAECGGWTPCPNKYKKVVDGSSCYHYDFCVSEITESDSHLVSGFTVPDQSTPERTLRTFWWAIKNGRKNIALACVDRKKVAEAHGIDTFRDIDEFISEFSQLDTSDFRFIVSETRVSIQSPHHNMDYDMEKRENGKWIIVSIHP